MLKVNTVQLTNEKYSGGFRCAVEFQIGDKSYNTATVELSPAATRRVVDQAIIEARAMIAFDVSGIEIKGEIKPLVGDEPEFAEVDEAPAPLVAEAELTPVSEDAF